MRSLKKMLLGAVTAMVLAAGVAVTPASATVPSWGNEGVNENTNVPYLAWRGEHVRLGFCVSEDLATLAQVRPGRATASWHTEDWSGDPLNGSIPVPFELVGTAQQHGPCFYTAFTSQKSGIAFIKLTLVDPVTNKYIYHQFLVIWMDLLKPSATIIGDDDVNAADFCQSMVDTTSFNGGLLPTIGHRICDPSIDPRHRVQVLVKGNVPLLANFSELGLGTKITLPDQWAALAGKLATCTATWPSYLTTACHTLPDAMTNWDIHDDSLATHVAPDLNGHVMTGGTQCDAVDETNPAGSQDEVDNCKLAAAEALVIQDGSAGPFSTVFGEPTQRNTWGPYDPMFPHLTLLSDGKLDAGDAPMPAARIDVTIRENNPLVATDISGVGYLHPSYKTEVYSRDGLGSDWWGNLNPPKAHNFYAPYYSQYIPATGRPADGDVLPTGVDGGTAAGFNGFLNSDPLYRNWEFAWDHSYHPNTDSKCLDQQTYLPFRQWFRPLPYGTSSVSVYTDESGEANVNFVPGLGMYFDNLAGVNKNLNMGCDLEGIDKLGTATIDAVAIYPYQMVTAQPIAADPVTFNVHNQFSKQLTVYSKGNDANGITSNSLAKIVLAHIQDIDGSPLAYEIVCWMADSNAQGMRVFVGDLPTSDPTKVISLDPLTAFFTAKDPWGLGRLCTYTNRWGNTAVEVYNSNGTSVDVIAEFVNEGILRHTDADFGVGSLGGVTSADGPATAIVPTPAQVKAASAVSATGPVLVKSTPAAFKTIKAKQAKVKKVLHKIRFAKVITPFHGKAKLQVRVNGKTGMVKLRITIKKGKKTLVFTRFVPANKTIAVKNLAIPAKTTKITVKLFAL